MMPEAPSPLESWLPTILAVLFSAVMLAVIGTLLVQQWLSRAPKPRKDPLPPFPGPVAQVLRRDRNAIHKAVELYHSLTGVEPLDAHAEIQAWLRMNPPEGPHRAARKPAPHAAIAQMPLPTTAPEAPAPAATPAVQDPWAPPYAPWPDERFPVSVAQMLHDDPHDYMATIAIFHDETGVGHDEARYHIEAWLSRGKHREKPATTSPAPTTNAAAPAPTNFPESAAAILRADPRAIIKAVQAYRAATGRGLRESKEAIDAWLAHAGAPPAPPPGSFDFPQSAAAILRTDPTRKIVAIKRYRQETGVGLKEAKDAVEAWLEAQK